MKLIQRLSLLASIALVATACDLQQTFDERIDDKQLLVLAPDFADTSVQLVFRDPETLAVIDEDFEVTVYANKRLIDANGNYKNEFIARGGVMEFFVSPEETVSEGDPLEIAVEAISNSSSLGLNFYTSKANRSGFNSITLSPETLPNLEEISANQQSIGPKTKEEIFKETEELSLDLSFNGVVPGPGPLGVAIDGVTVYRFTDNDINSSRGRDLYWIAGRLNKDLTIIVEGPTLLLGYYLTITYDLPNSNVKTRYDIYEDGSFRRTSSLGEFTLSYQEGIINNYQDLLRIPSNSKPLGATISWRKKEVYKICNSGFNINFQFEGTQSYEKTTVLYRGIRSFDDGNFMLASSSVASPGTMVNSLDHLQNHIIGVSGNTLEFAENDQYFIEPQIIELGGEELCGNTYTVTLKPKETHKKHNLNLSMRSEDQSVGVALTFSALLRKQGQDDTKWQTIQFKQGSTSVYLEEGSTYEVKLTLADEPFEFTFTNDLSLVDAAVQATKRNLSRIKDITYSISQTQNENTIDAEIVFYDGQSLVD